MGLKILAMKLQPPKRQGHLLRIPHGHALGTLPQKPRWR